LNAIGQRLRHNVRAHDVVSRVGGDEFIILANNLDSEQHAQELGNKLLTVFDDAFTLGPAHITIGLTIGYAVIPLDANESAAALKLADTAMYVGKEAGKRTLRRAVSVPAGGERARDSDEPTHTSPHYTPTPDGRA
jgi:diguanylate cyclase (GGDEF)-like protein